MSTRYKSVLVASLICASVLLSACEGGTQTPESQATPTPPNTSFKSQPNPKITAITLHGNKNPSQRQQSHSALFSDRSIQLDLSELSGTERVKQTGTHLGGLSVDGQNLKSAPAGQYLSGLFSNLKHVDVTALECDDWVETGCNLTFKIDAEKALTSEAVSCSVVIDMENQVTDSCGF